MDWNDLIFIKALNTPPHPYPFIWVNFPKTGKIVKMWHSLTFLELCCDQTAWFVQLFSTVLKTFCPLNSKNVGPSSFRTRARAVWSWWRWGWWWWWFVAFLEWRGQNLFRTVEKSWKNQTVWTQQSSKKKFKKCHILTIFPVQGKLTHMRFIQSETYLTKTCDLPEKNIILMANWRWTDVLTRCNL